MSAIWSDSLAKKNMAMGLPTIWRCISGWKLGFSNVIFKNTLGRDMLVPRIVAFYELLTDLMRGSWFVLWIFSFGSRNHRLVVLPKEASFNQTMSSTRCMQVWLILDRLDPTFTPVKSPPSLHSLNLTANASENSAKTPQKVKLIFKNHWFSGSRYTSFRDGKRWTDSETNPVLSWRG